ncbi:PQQ-like beta-propeller repeat protein [Magnetospira thiophila]
MPQARVLRAVPALALMLLALSACGTWFGEKDDAPLPGERISVLLHEQTLTPDKEVAGQEILLPPPSINAEWPQSGGYANHAMHHTQSADVPQQVWTADVGAGADDTDRLIAQPIIADGKVFTIDSESMVSAFDEKTGDVLWRRDLTPDDEDDAHIAGGLAYYRGGLFVTTGFAEVFAINAVSGKVFWRYRASAPMRAAPAARHGKVFVVTTDNKLLALNAATGNLAWTYEALSEEVGLLGSATPAVDRGIVVAAFLSGELVALRADSGRELWNESLASRRRVGALSNMFQIRGNPVIDRERVFAINHGGLLVAVDLRTGQRVWEEEIAGSDMPWVAGDYIYVLTNDSELLCLSRKNGALYWVASLPRWEDEEEKLDLIVWSGPLLASDRLVVAGSNGLALALSPYDGHVLGQVELPDRVKIPPVIANGTLYFLSDDATLVAYR